jgi:hypothetical protein
LVDDALDRAGDFERGMRDSVSRALDDDPYDRDDRHHCHHHRGHDRDDRWDDRGHHDRDHRDRDRDHRDRDRDHWDRDRDHRDRDPYPDGPPDGDRRRDDRPSAREGRNADEFRALKDQLSQLANRIDRMSGA